VLATGTPAWIAQLSDDDNFPRRAAAEAAGVCAAFAFPVLVDARVDAVFEFFGTDPVEPDEALLETMATIGLSLGRVFERMRAQDALRESEARLRALADTASDAIVTIDHDDRILFANPAAARLFGVPLDRLRAMHFSELMPERFRARHRAGLMRFITTGERHIPWDGIELPGLRADGSEVPLEITFGTFTREARTFFTGIMRDVTERKRAEEERRLSLERERQARAAAEEAQGEAERRARQESALREAAAGVAAAFTVDETAHRIAESALIATQADGAYVERIDIESGDVVVVAVAGQRVPPLGARVPYAESVTREVVEREASLMLEPLASSRRRLPADLERRCGLCSAAVIPLLDAGEPVGGLVLLRAPGKHVFRDDELARAYTFGDLAGLAFRKIHLLEDSERKREELERVMESRTRLINGFSHDVKNPMGAADGFLALLEEGVIPGELPATHREAIGRARRSLGSAMRLIDDLLEFARAESGQIELRPAPVDARESAREIIAEQQAQAERAGLTVRFEAPDEFPIIESDPARVRQIIGNLLSTAVKYTPVHGEVVVRVAEGYDHVWVSVTDSGPGIPKEKREFLFEEFTRLDPTNSGGAGIGLAISRRLARALGGELTVESEVGNGSTFTLVLPRRAAPGRALPHT
jgi:PAS domain S-box-containing protein